MNIRTIITAITLVAATTASAANQGNGNITIKTGKVSKQLVETWITAYKAVRPEVNITIVSNNADANLTLSTATTNDGVNVAEGTNTTAVGRTAILPVTSAENPLLSEIEKKRWNDKELKKLFFQTDDDLLDDGEQKTKKEKLADKLTVFSGNNKTSAAQTYAEHFGVAKSDFRGKRIAGDDIYLLNAIQKEKQAVTFNTLTYLYDLSSRSLKQNLVILPLNVKKEQAETLGSGNLDKTLDLLEQQKVEGTAVGSISFTYQLFNTDIEDFLSWVVSDGQQYNHSAGFLKLNTSEAKQQLKLLAER